VQQILKNVMYCVYNKSKKMTDRENYANIDCIRYFRLIRIAQAYQSAIRDLHKLTPLPKAEIKSLQIKRDIIVLDVESRLDQEEWIGEYDEYSLRKALFKDRRLPFKRSFYECIENDSWYT
jgi:hypothetical protein